MGTYDSIQTLEQAILSRMYNATNYALTDVYKIFDEKMNDFYDEYTPTPVEYGGYNRTYQLFDSLDLTDVEPITNGYSGDVFFRNENVNYIDDIDDRGLSNEEIINLNLKGHTHGLAADGTAVWTDPIEEARLKKDDILRRALNKAGLSC